MTTQQANLRKTAGTQSRNIRRTALLSASLLAVFLGGCDTLDSWMGKTPDPPLPVGQYEIKVLVYDAETLEPLGLQDAAGTPTGIEATLGQVRIEQAE